MANLKIFHLNRLKYQLLWDDAIAYISLTYGAIGEKFSSASPFALLLSVILHLGRMILYYIEDSITGLNIRTAYRPELIKGLATLAGHDAARPISARGAIRIKYIDTGTSNSNDIGGVCYIPNKAQIKSKLNGLSYIILLGADTGKITMQSGNYLDATIIQGELKLQSATGTGEKLQSYNFAERNYQEVDQYYVNVYVNNEPWTIVSSLLDLGYNQKGCIVKTGFNGGIDVFFGNEDMGMCPGSGSSIIVEYVKTDGNIANLEKTYVNSNDYWEFISLGYTVDGNAIDLDEHFKIECLTDVIFGTPSEDTALTQTIAPHVSRSMVLANETNYLYFFKRMNMFSDVEIMQGTSLPTNNSILLLAADLANNNYNTVLQIYNNMVNQYGALSAEAQSQYEAVQTALNTKLYTELRLQDKSYKDNTIFIYLVPDITRRISGSQTYFSCDESLFLLTPDEQNNIINLIEESGQKIITVENRIVQPKIARFAVNVYAKIWNNYNELDVYASGMQVLSDYFLSFKRKDIIPVSDIISLFENNVKGIDSVRVSFDADTNNEIIYGQKGFYGIDEYGDIVLSRLIIDNYGNTKLVRDIIPLIRGGFTSPDGVEYSKEQSYLHTSAYNLTITAVTNKRNSLLTNYDPLT